MLARRGALRRDGETLVAKPLSRWGSSGYKLTVAEDAFDAPMSGRIPYSIGQTSAVRIQFPVQLACASNFIQDMAGKRPLRLDYGHNHVTKTFDYHWNQRGTHQYFGLTGHSSAGRAGQVAYNAAKYFRYAGRVMLVAGAAMDAVSIVFASRPLRRASEVVAAWAGAWVGCKVTGAGGAAVGTAVSPGLGTAAGGFVGCVVGGIGGYFGGETIGASVYDWAEETVFSPVPEVPGP
jgi:hypothetical protein